MTLNTVGDSRITLARPDLADLRLEGLVPAARYEASRVMVCAVPATAIRAAAAPDAEQWDQLLFGEVFRVLEDKDGFAWGQAPRDGYVGYVATSDLMPQGHPPTHAVSVIRTHAFSEPSIKSPARGPYSLNSLISIEEREGRFAKGVGTGWFIETHLTPIGRGEKDYVAVAMRFLGAPYSGAAAKAWAWTARASSSRPSTPATAPVRVIPTCSRASSPRWPRPTASAATWCSGRATSPSSWTLTPSSTPTPTTWRRRWSRWPRRWRGSRRRRRARCWGIGGSSFLLPLRERGNTDQQKGRGAFASRPLRSCQPGKA